MMRGSPSAELLGRLLLWVRWVKTGESTRALSAKLGAPPATVSQVENGQRALKMPKLAAWAMALDVDEDDLRELWWLCQGMVATAAGHRAFYADRPDLLPPRTVSPGDGVADCIDQYPELEPIYRLAEAICILLRRMLPKERFFVRTWEIPFDQPTREDLKRAGDGPLPVVWVLWSNPDVSDEPQDLKIPLIEKPGPITRKRATSVASEDLEALIRSLSGIERERVRGYIEAIIEQRDRQGHEFDD